MKGFAVEIRTMLILNSMTTLVIGDKRLFDLMYRKMMETFEEPLMYKNSNDFKEELLYIAQTINEIMKEQFMT